MPNQLINSNTSQKSFYLDWSRRQNKYFSKLHGIASYLASFLPSLPGYFINKYSQPNDVIMDNFCGRGTTGLVARELNRRFIGSDLNPYAYVISKFKTSQISLISILKTLEKLQDEYLHSPFKNMSKNQFDDSLIELQNYYDEDVLKQLLFIREKCGKSWLNNAEEINGILAIALGLMHGPMRKNGTTMYFSLNMPNTISMSPNYVKQYSFKNKLIKPKVNVFKQIQNRLQTKYDDILNTPYDGKIFYQDATIENTLIANESIDLVITSPPYLNIVNYAQSNWLRLWLLGYERKSLNKTIKLSDKLNFEQYIAFIKKYLNAIYPKLKNNAKVCLVVGDVREIKLIENVWNIIQDDVNYKLVEIYYDNEIIQTHKSTNLLNCKSGKATKQDKVLTLERNEK